MYRVLVISVCVFWGCSPHSSHTSDLLEFSSKKLTAEQEKIVREYALECAHRYNYYTYEWQECLDQGVKKDSTIAYLWQQKGMPYLKQQKYEVGLKYIDKAVKFDAKRYLPYRGFVKCIFAKDYRGAIADFQRCLEEEGNLYVMDHTYNFYIGLSHLQLNEFKIAEEIFREDIRKQEEQFGEAHYLDVFYFGIAQYEQKKWDNAICTFEKALKYYSNFSDAKYYLAISYWRIGDSDKYEELIAEGKEDAVSGYTINEGNAVYEKYPYKVMWGSVEGGR